MSMESLTLLFNDEDFDRLVKKSRDEGTPQASIITIAVKDNVTRDGKPGVVVSFEAIVDGKKRTVQATTTLALIRTAFGAIIAKYEDF